MLDGIAVGIGINATLTGMDKLQQLAAHLTALSTQTDKITAQITNLGAIITGVFSGTHVKGFEAELQHSIGTVQKLNTELAKTQTGGGVNAGLGRVRKPQHSITDSVIANAISFSGYEAMKVLHKAVEAAANQDSQMARMRLQGYTEPQQQKMLQQATSTRVDGVNTTEKMRMMEELGLVLGKDAADPSVMKPLMQLAQVSRKMSGEGTIASNAVDLWRGAELTGHMFNPQTGQLDPQKGIHEATQITRGIIAGGGQKGFSAEGFRHTYQQSSQFLSMIGQEMNDKTMAMMVVAQSKFGGRAGDTVNAVLREQYTGEVVKGSAREAKALSYGILNTNAIAYDPNPRNGKAVARTGASMLLGFDPNDPIGTMTRQRDAIRQYLERKNGRKVTDNEVSVEQSSFELTKSGRGVTGMFNQAGIEQQKMALEALATISTDPAILAENAKSFQGGLEAFTAAAESAAAAIGAQAIKDAGNLLYRLAHGFEALADLATQNPNATRFLTLLAENVLEFFAIIGSIKLLKGFGGALLKFGAPAALLGAAPAVAGAGAAAGGAVAGGVAGAEVGALAGGVIGGGLARGLLSKLGMYGWAILIGDMIGKTIGEGLKLAFPETSEAGHKLLTKGHKDDTLKSSIYGDEYGNSFTATPPTPPPSALTDLSRFDPMMARSFGSGSPGASPLAPHHTISPRPEPYHEPSIQDTNRPNLSRAQMLGYAPMPGMTTPTLAPLRHGSQLAPSSNVPVPPQEPIVPGLIPPSFPTSSLQPAPGEPELPTGLAPRSGVAPVVPGLNAPAFPETTARTPEGGSSDINVNNIYAKNLYVAALILSGNRSLPGSPLGETGGTTGTAPITGSSPVAIPSAFRTGNRIPAMSPWSNVQPNANETTDGSGVTPISLPSGGVPGIQPGLNDTGGIAPSGVPGIQPATAFPPPSPSSTGSSGTLPSAGSPTSLAPTSAPFSASAAGSSFSQQAPMVMARLMKDFNLTKQQAAGIVGNLGHESGGFKQLQELNPQGGGKGGFGWAQWTGPRRTAFLENAKSLGLDPKSPEANYSFLSKELRTTESKSLAAVRGQTTEHGSMMAFEGAYERAGIKHYESRDKYTDIALNKFNQQQDIGSGNNMVLPPPSQPNYSMQADIHLDGEHIAQHTFNKMFDTNPVGNAGTTGFDKKMHSWASGTSIPR